MDLATAFVDFAQLGANWVLWLLIGLSVISVGVMIDRGLWFRGRDIGFAPVKDLREAFDDPQAAARGMRLVDADGHEHIGVPIKFAAEPARPRFELPRIGADNERILAGLGYSAEEIARLRAEGAIASD